MIQSQSREYEAALKGYYLGESDRKELFALLRHFAQQGKAKAMMLLSLMYRDGDGTDANESARLDWLRQLADLADAGDPDAAYEVGMGCLWGDQFPTDMVRGRNLLTAAADAGNADAQFELSVYFRTGQFGFEIDEELAKQMLLNAVKQGHSEAMYNRAVELMNDPSRRDSALELLHRAALHHQKAKELLASIQH
jgi:TPR repeat protein